MERERERREWRETDRTGRDKEEEMDNNNKKSNKHCPDEYTSMMRINDANMCFLDPFPYTRV